MSEVLEVWLVRHGETQWNREHRMQGDSDIPLNALGLKQAQQLAKRIGHMTFDAYYSSDLDRALTTGRTVFPDRDIQTDARLREINLGVFEGRAWPEIPEDEQAQLLVWLMGPYDQKVPGGESSDDLRARVMSWLQSLPASGRVIAFAHGGTIASILQVITGRPEPRTFNDKGGWGFRLGNTSISKLLISETFTTVDTVNDTAHLDDMDAPEEA